MKIGLFGHGIVGRGVTAILDGKYPDLEITKILVKDLSEGNDPRYTLSAEEILNDPEIGIDWGCDNPILNERDANNPFLKDIQEELF